MKRRALLGMLSAPAVLGRARASYKLPVVPAIVRPQIIANGGMIPEISPTVTNESLWETRATVRNGWYPASDVRLIHYTGYIDANGGGEKALTNPVTFQAALEQTSIGKVWMASFGGSYTLVSQSNALVRICEPIGVNLLASETFKVQLAAQVNLGDNIALGRFLAATTGLTGWDSFRSTLTTSQIGTAGVWDATARLVGNGGPTITGIIGTPSQNYVAIAGLGDSNLVGRDDAVTDAGGNFGHIAKALFTSGPGGTSVPFINLAQSGEQASTVVSGGANARLSLLKYVSHVITNYGINDLRHGGFSVSQTTANLTKIWAALRARGLKVFEQTLPPWTTSIDGWSSVGGQTIVTNYGPGGFRDQVNAFKVAAVAAGTIDGLIDINAAVEDQSNPGLWRTNAGALTADGQHKNSLGHTLCVPVARAVTSTFTLPPGIARIPI